MRKALIAGLCAAMAAASMAQAPAVAMPLTNGAPLSVINDNPMIEQVQVRRRAPVRRYARRGGGINPGAALGVAAAIGVVGAAIIANQQRDDRRERLRAQQQQYYYGGQPAYYGQQQQYYQPQQRCYYDTQPTYDGYGNFCGNQQVQVCR